MYEGEQRWGISTGAAFPNEPIDQAVRKLLPYKPQVIELCPGTTPVSKEQLGELNRIRAGEKLLYTVHMAKSYMPGNSMTGSAEWFRRNNQTALEVAREVNPLWVVHHPPITPDGSISEYEVETFLSLLKEYRLPVLIESGVFRRDNKNDPTQVTSVESCRTPRDFIPYLREPVVGVVADVPKMARSRELPEDGRKSLDDISFYAMECQRLQIPVRQMHIIGVDFWPEDHTFAKHALNQMRMQGIKPDTLIIESHLSRLPATVDLVKERIAA